MGGWGDGWPGAQMVFECADWLFGLLFSVEALLKFAVYAHRYPITHPPHTITHPPHTFLRWNLMGPSYVKELLSFFESAFHLGSIF